jgi:hypothetical protein
MKAKKIHRVERMAQLTLDVGQELGPRTCGFCGMIYSTSGEDLKLHERSCRQGVPLFPDRGSAIAAISKKLQPKGTGWVHVDRRVSSLDVIVSQAASYLMASSRTKGGVVDSSYEMPQSISQLAHIPDLTMTLSFFAFDNGTPELAAISLWLAEERVVALNVAHSGAVRPAYCSSAEPADESNQSSPAISRSPSPACERTDQCSSYRTVKTLVTVRDVLVMAKSELPKKVVSVLALMQSKSPAGQTLSREAVAMETIGYILRACTYGTSLSTDRAVFAMHLGDAAAVDGDMIRKVLEGTRTTTGGSTDIMWLPPEP